MNPPLTSWLRSQWGLLRALDHGGCGPAGGNARLGHSTQELSDWEDGPQWKLPQVFLGTAGSTRDSPVGGTLRKQTEHRTIEGAPVGGEQAGIDFHQGPRAVSLPGRRDTPGVWSASPASHHAQYKEPWSRTCCGPRICICISSSLLPGVHHSSLCSLASSLARTRVIELRGWGLAGHCVSEGATASCSHFCLWGAEGLREAP